MADKRAGGFSLGMGQRLGIAAALLGDPGILLLDEPVNGLDPEGILWIRNLLRSLAAEGRTVFVSSHLMSEMALTADHLIVIGRGRLIADTSVEDFIRRSSRNRVRVRSPQADALVRGARDRRGHRGRRRRRCAHRHRARPATRSATSRAAAGIALHELSPQTASLEEAFMELTQEQRRVPRRRLPAEHKEPQS